MREMLGELVGYFKISSINAMRCAVRNVNLGWARKWSDEAQANGATLSEEDNRRTLLQTLARLPG